jgi:hypothetical protein
MSRDLNGSDAKYLKYKCPIFYRYVICASGYNEQTKENLKELVETKGGGTYRGELICGTTTHLVLSEPKGSKYDAAKSWRIAVVKPEWVYESIEAGYCLPEANYALESVNHTSTPTDMRRQASKKTANMSSLNDISVIPGALNNSVKCVNETENNSNKTMSITQLNATAASSKPSNAGLKTAEAELAEILKELNSIGKVHISLFDGIGVSFFVRATRFNFY